MIKLKENNIQKYLESLGLFKDIEWAKIEISEVTEYTNVNFIFAVDLKKLPYERVFIKQAFEFVKIKPDFPAPIERHKYEKLTIDYLQQFWKGRIPENKHQLVIIYSGYNAPSRFRQFHEKICNNNQDIGIVHLVHVNISNTVQKG